MFSNKLIVAAALLTLLSGCQSKSTPATNEELRLLTPEQEKRLTELTDRVEPKEIIRQTLKDSKGNVVGAVSSQTNVIYLKSGGGFHGGRFSVSTQCQASCSGTPTFIDPSKPNNSCAGSVLGCDPSNGGCTACTCAAGCTPSCQKTSTGFGDFGIFIAGGDANTPPLHASVRYTPAKRP